jgi:serine/threonine protein kinase
MKSRGTECIKSPEMLTLALQSKKEADHYDRRKKIGTTRASDIWSLGCLFYEILTGEFLFHRADWVNFYVHVTSHNEELLVQENIEKLGGNTLLVEFLKFMLIRDPHHRPSITNLIDKYDHLYALLVNAPPNHDNNVLKSPLAFN